MRDSRFAYKARATHHLLSKAVPVRPGFVESFSHTHSRRTGAPTLRAVVTACRITAVAASWLRHEGLAGGVACG